VRIARRLVIAGLTGIVIAVALVSIFIAEGCVRGWARRQPDPTDADRVARAASATWQSARVTAADGAPLSAWLFTPRQPNGSAVILLHGVADTRRGVLFHAQYLLQAGFTVLAPDSRGHGASGGDLLTYGIREAADIHAWADELFRTRPIQRLYGLGESMGAAILIESLPREPRFRAVVAECPFSTLEEIAYYRIEQISGLGRWASWPLVRSGFLYVRLRYGVDLKQASLAAAIRATEVPVLLIHGTRDVIIPPRHSQALHALNPQATTLWLVPGAMHVSAISACPEEYERRVVGWFRSHP
jgi:alpha-beta hydrolase superfamily lysophospholipase